jgi:hypothetical protein
MGPEFNEKLQWARYLQMEHNEARRKERARMAKIEEEIKKEEEDKDVEDKYMNYNVEEESTEETKTDKIPEIFAVVFSLLFFGGLLGTIFWIIATLS